MLGATQRNRLRTISNIACMQSDFIVYTRFEMDICLDLHGVQIAWETEQVADIIIRVAQGLIEEPTLSDWLRTKAG